MNYHKAVDGEWIQPRRKNYYMKCCDCGLTHALNFRVIKTKDNRAFIQFRARRIKSRKVEKNFVKNMKFGTPPSMLASRLITNQRGG